MGVQGEVASVAFNHTFVNPSDDNDVHFNPCDFVDTALLAALRSGSARAIEVRVISRSLPVLPPPLSPLAVAATAVA
jgi:hypothetical protein